MKYKNKSFVRVVKFLVSGGSAALVEYLVFLLLHYMQVDLLMANSLSFISGFLVSFTLNRAWVFSSKDAVPKQLLIYATLAVANLIFSNVAIWLLVNELSLLSPYAKIITMGTIACWNYFLYSRYIFKKETTKDHPGIVEKINDTNKKKIAIFTGYFLPHLGGVERYVDKLSKSLKMLGYDIVIVTSNEANMPNFEDKETYSIYRLPILNVAKNRYPIPRVNKEYKALIKGIENEKIDYFLVNTRFHLTSLVGGRMAKRLNKPSILLEHGTGHFSVDNKLLDFFGAIYEHILSYILKKYITKYYGVSKNCNKWLRHFSVSASGVFYNAISKSDKDKVKTLYDSRYSKDVIVITYAGRLIKEKGILNLIEAYSRVRRSTGDIPLRLVIAGDGELMGYIKERYIDNKVIDILGRLDFDHVMSLYKRTDIFVYPSLYPEGLPTSILEAGLMKCAIIATPKGGTEEVIIDDNHGIIVDGSIDSLYNAMLRYIGDEDKRRNSASSVCNRIETVFEWDSVAQKVDSVLNGLNKDSNNDKR